MSRTKNPERTPEPYYMRGGFECIDIMRAIATPDEFQAFCRLTAFKYLYRLGAKDDPEREIKKAMDYTQWLYESIRDETEVLSTELEAEAQIVVTSCSNCPFLGVGTGDNVIHKHCAFPADHMPPSPPSGVPRYVLSAPSTQPPSSRDITSAVQQQHEPSSPLRCPLRLVSARITGNFGTPSVPAPDPQPCQSEDEDAF